MKPKMYNDGTGDQHQKYTITTTEHQRNEWRRAALALGMRGATHAAKMLRDASHKEVLDVPDYDRAASAYRTWLVFDEPKP